MRKRSVSHLRCRKRARELLLSRTQMHHRQGLVSSCCHSVRGQDRTAVRPWLAGKQHLPWRSTPISDSCKEGCTGASKCLKGWVEISHSN